MSANESFDVSLILTLHREGDLLQRTLLSLREATDYARAHGITVELVATLDRADDTTRRILMHFPTGAFNGFTAVEVDHGSPGPSRNSGIRVAHGRYINICDGDDLISFNSIADSFRLAESAGPGHIIFPEYVYKFGDYYDCTKCYPIADVTPLPFIEWHPYNSQAFAHRSVFEAVPYADPYDLRGWVYEDWHFNAECVARGYRILIAEDTVLFYRQRHSRSSNQSGDRSSRQIGPCTLFHPQTWIRVSREAYERFSPLAGACLNAQHGAASIVDTQRHRALIRAANVIDPAIDIVRFKSAFRNNFYPLTSGLAYYEICRIIGAQRFDEVFLLPFLAEDDISFYPISVMQSIYDVRATAAILVLLGESPGTGKNIERVPPNATVLDLWNDWPILSIEQRQLIALKLIQNAAPKASLHLWPSAFAEGLYGRFGNVLSNPTVFYRTDDIAKSISSSGPTAKRTPETQMLEAQIGALRREFTLHRERAASDRVDLSQLRPLRNSRAFRLLGWYYQIRDLPVLSSMIGLIGRSIRRGNRT